jgi:hypothetical protein
VSLSKREYHPDEAAQLSAPLDTKRGDEPAMDLDAIAKELLNKIIPSVKETVKQEFRVQTGDLPGPHVSEIFRMPSPLRATSKSSTMGEAPGYVRPGSLGSHTYSLARVMRAVAERNSNLAPLEYDISQKLERLGYHSSAGGWQIPLGWDLTAQAGLEQETEALDLDIKALFPRMVVDPEQFAWMRTKMSGSKAMDTLDESAGASTFAFPSLGPLIDLLRPATAVLRAGATEVPLPPQGSTSFPRLKSDATFMWGPAPHVAISESTPGTGALNMTAKRASAFVVLSNDLVRYSLGAAEAMVRQSLMLRSAWGPRRAPRC